MLRHNIKKIARLYSQCKDYQNIGNNFIDSVLSKSRPFSTVQRNAIILGIETSCDDTGCAVMNVEGKILGDAIHSQQLVHLKNGGIIPPIAQDLHRKYIQSCVDESFKKANVSIKDIDAIAVTVKPGLPLSLSIGLKYAKYLSKRYSKPIIPIHHMEAHALAARIENDVQFPFLCLLISGGHCILTLVNDVDDFRLLGETMDDSPGEAFDKLARRLKLHNLPEFSRMSGGAAIESAAKKSDTPQEFHFPSCLPTTRDCNFSFSGIKSTAQRHIVKQELNHSIGGGTLIPGVYDLCAAFQIAVARHLAHRTERAMKYVEKEDLVPEGRRTLVVSGGVACNNYIYNALEMACQIMDFKIARPSPKLCVDNGVMIAWNGIEKLRKDLDIMTDLDKIDITSRCALGVDISESVTSSGLICKQLPLKNFYELNERMKAAN